VEAGWNTSTGDLRVVEGDEKGTKCLEVYNWAALSLGDIKQEPGVLHVGGFEAKLTNLLYIRITAAGSKEVKNLTPSRRIF
jgi:hypothetical protein